MKLVQLCGAAGGLALFIASHAVVAQEQAAPTPQKQWVADGVPIPRGWTPPEYPADLKARKVQGAVVLHLVIDETGRVASVRAAEASDPLFAAVVEASVRAAQWDPGISDSKPVAMGIALPWRFTLPYRPDPIPQGIAALPKTPAKPEFTPNPEYPAGLVSKQLAGEVITDVIVAADGGIAEVKVLDATCADFVRPALEAVKKWRFQPARQGDLAIQDLKRVPLTFEYQSSLEPTEETSLSAKGVVFDLPEGASVRSVCDSPPEPVLWVEPIFPLELLSGGPGEAEVSFTVNPRGYPENVEVRRASVAACGQALASAVQSWVFRPAMQGGRACEVRLMARRVFSLPAETAEGEAEEVRLLRLIQQGQTIPGAKGLDAKLRPVWRAFPVYPPALKASRVSGTAEVEFVIDRTGRARVPKVISASHEEFGWAAMTAVGQWVFDAPRRGGDAVDVRIRVPLEFSPE